MSGSEDHVLTVLSTEEDAGERLDRYLARDLPTLSRARIQSLIADGGVTANGRVITNQSAKVTPETQYVLCVPPAEEVATTAESIPLDVVFEDDDLIVINKPAGLVVHPAPGHEAGTLVNALIAHCGASLSGIGGEKRPGIVHRLDKDTSGLLVVAKNDATHQSLSAQFASHGRDGRMSRKYKAIAWGAVTRPKGRIDAPLRRSKINRRKISVAKPGLGREAATQYTLLETFDSHNSGKGHPGSDGKPARVAASYVELVLETGRTHQIRVHMAHLGHPLMGDELYGLGFKSRAVLLAPHAADALSTLCRQALHAEQLGFEHPRSKEPMRFTAPLPEDFQRLLDALRNQ